LEYGKGRFEFAIRIRFPISEPYIKKHLFVCFLSLLGSTTALAKDLILPKNNIKIELSSNCKITANNDRKTVACTAPILDARYEEKSFDTPTAFFKKVQREAKSLFKKDGNIKIHTISEYDITPYYDNGEFHHFMIFMDVQGIKFIQHYTHISR